MMRQRAATSRRRLFITWRIAWTLLTLIAVEALVCALSIMPVVLAWHWIQNIVPPGPAVRLFVWSALIVPSYVAFALCLMVIAPAATRLVGWHTPADAQLRIADMDWALLKWVRYGASLHLVRLVAGSLFRGTPIWTAHLRLSGARIGKRVYVNSLSVSDYNLLDFGDGVVIGGGVHLSGHTVEAGIVKTARVRVGRNVTIGLGSVIEIGAEIGPDAQVGALSFVPKYTTLKGGVTYAGAPAVPIE
jgi:acetyltransferase-like isoleucine patch superfamily enzyme